MVHFETNPVFRFDDWILLPADKSYVNSRSEVNTVVHYNLRNDGVSYLGTPLICANMAAIASFKMATRLADFAVYTCLHKFHTPLQMLDFYRSPGNTHTLYYTFYTVGLQKVEFDNLLDLRDELKDHYDEHLGLNCISNICLDVPNGYITKFIDRVKVVRDEFPNALIMAGNVCTPEGCRNLIKAGADIIKVNIGTGQQCLTSSKAAIGRSSMQTILECAPACKAEGKLLVSDGGYGDAAKIIKGLACGANAIMIGSILAGTDECCGEFIKEERDLTSEECLKQGLVTSVEEFWNKKYQGNNFKHITNHGMKLYGMASKYANEKFAGGLRHYRAVEGKETIVPYKGPVGSIVQDILGSMRSACTYLGNKEIKDISRYARFERI